MLDHCVTLDSLLTLSGPQSSAQVGRHWTCGLWGLFPLCIPVPCSPQMSVCQPHLEESVTYKVKQTKEKKKKKHLRLENKSCEGIRNGGCQMGADPIK